ncbi:hypothetical protein GCM10009675_38470 [Prauserella alba]|uniref:Uncharacterized protein n=1 Tax=Prauserella alba TaxID=176898 RepID=A0ABN1VLE5_9PSEU
MPGETAPTARHPVKNTAGPSLVDSDGPAARVAPVFGHRRTAEAGTALRGRVIAAVRDGGHPAGRGIGRPDLPLLGFRTGLDREDRSVRLQQHVLCHGAEQQFPGR